MTCLEKWKKEHPNEDEQRAISDLCPNDDFGIDIEDPINCAGGENGECAQCWNREIPGTEADPTPTIKDSGERRQFDTGAVRDIQEGKGRCDLMPLDVVGEITKDPIIVRIADFTVTGDRGYLRLALCAFDGYDNWPEMYLEVSKHFEDGAKKYGEYNWQKGIPVRCYIDSAVRHYLKFKRGDRDEPHDRAFCWNIICAIWTCKHKPALNEYMHLCEKEKIEE